MGETPADAKPARTAFMYWTPAGYGMYGGTTEAEAVEKARKWERTNGPTRCRVTEHDTSVHALGHRPDETLVREVEFAHYDPAKGAA